MADSRGGQDLDESARAVAARLGHEFGDPRLLAEALAHSSFANERPNLAPRDNERLELLGDAVLQWAVSALLWERFPDATAGELTRRRADLVCEEGLAAIAEDVEIGTGLRLGRGEERSGGRNKPRLLASAFEACVAAVYLDAGAEIALEVCRRLFAHHLRSAPPGARDFKTRFQELLQERGREPPQYEVVATGGPDHARTFEVTLELDGREVGRGIGRSKLEAEQSAAKAALEKLETSDG